MKLLVANKHPNCCIKTTQIITNNFKVVVDYQRHHFLDFNQMETFINFFKTSTLWQDMKNTTENTAWHREDNVATHTEMVLTECQTFQSENTTEENNLLQLSYLFHDVGKPVSMEFKNEKNTFSGHEQISSVLFVEYYASNINEFHRFIPNIPLFPEIVKFLIENHLPYGLGKPKQQILKQALKSFSEPGVLDVEKVFLQGLLCDSKGRISDDHQTKIDSVEQWISDFKLLEIPDTKIDFRQKKEAFILIGPSGSGKSTFSNSIKSTIISLDNFRYGFYYQLNEYRGTFDDYPRAFKYCVENEKELKKFYSKQTEEILKYCIENDTHPIIDNTNLHRKARGFWIEQLRKFGFKVVAVDFWNKLDTLMSRKDSRTDKRISMDVVVDQMSKQTVPKLGTEVDEIILKVGK